MKLKTVKDIKNYIFATSIEFNYAYWNIDKISDFIGDDIEFFYELKANDGVYLFYFKHATDAMAFKLRWA